MTIKDSDIRRLGQAAHNVSADPDRKVMEDRWGQVWNTTELQQDFEVRGFLAPYVRVHRKSDGAEGTLAFSHYPRWYYNFTPNN